MPSGSAWQNPYVERFVGTLRRELLDHVIVLGEAHLRRRLKGFVEDYYHTERPHEGLDGDTPAGREPLRLDGAGLPSAGGQVSFKQAGLTGYPCLGGHPMSAFAMVAVFIRGLLKERLELAAENLASIPVLGGLHHRYARAA